MQTGPARATTSAVARRSRRATTAVGARAKAYLLGRRRLLFTRAATPTPGRERMRASDNACAQVTTSAPVRRRVPCGRGVFSQTPQTSALGRRRLCPSDNVCARATTGAAWEECFFTNTPNFSARATTSVSERQRLRPCDNECRVAGVFFHKHPKLQRSGDDVSVRATTSAPVQRRVPRGRGVFSQTPQTSALGQRHLCPSDNVCARATTGAMWEGCFFTNTPNFSTRATTSASGRRRLDPFFQTLAFFRALAIQTKLFHYLFLKITETVLKMVIQSYFY